MTFWTLNNFAPKQNFKFSLTFSISQVIGGRVERFSIPYHHIVSVERPSFSVKTKSFNHINRKINHPTNVTWSPINISLIDVEDNTAFSFISELYKRNGYDLTSITANEQTIFKDNFKIDTIAIDQLDSDGNAVESWFLNNAWISDIKNYANNYSSFELSTLQLTIVYDYATIVMASEAATETVEN